MRHVFILLALFSCTAFAADLAPNLGLGPVPVTGGLPPGGAAGGGLGGTYPNPTVTLAATQVGYGSGSNTLTGAPGFAVVGTPSATAPSTGASAPGLIPGVVTQSDGSNAAVFTSATFGNGAAQTTGTIGYPCQGTSAAPGATILNDTLVLQLRGHDGTNYVGNAGGIAVTAGSTWSPSNHENFIQFATTPNGSTTRANAGRIDPNQTLVWGGAFNGSGTFSAGTQRPHIQTSSSNSNNANIAQVLWAASTAGPTGIFAKSRSATVGTQGVITTGDTLGTMSWQGDDGTNFINAADITVTCTGPIGTGQVPGIMKLRTATSAGAITAAVTIDSAQGVTTAAGMGAHARSVVSAAGTTVLDASDHLVVVTGSTTQTLTLPAASVAHMIWLKNRSSGTVTVNRAGSDTIDGGTSITLTGGANQGYILSPVGTDYLIYARAN